MTVPVRGLDDGFATAEIVTVPDPLPEFPATIVSHVALLTAVHEHPVAPVTPIEVVAEPAPMEAVRLDRVNVHVPAACVTATAWPATVSVPVRARDDVLAVTAN